MLPGGLGSGGGGRGGGGLCLLRWLGLRLWSRRGTLVFALLWFGSWLFLNGLVLVHRTILSDFCTDDKSKRILQRLCLEFSEGSVTGDMCEDLCVLGLVEYKRCLYYENGKKVIEARWRGSPIILKSKLENFSSYEPLGILDYQDAAEELSPLDVVFYATLEVRNSLGLAEETEDADRGGGVNNSSLARLLGKKLKNREMSYSRAELASLWALLQQEEYTFLRVLQDLSTHVAKVLGSCGHFYAVEYLSAGHAWDQNIFSLDDVAISEVQDQGEGGDRARWKAREMMHRIALSFLDMVWHFDNDFTHKLHLCDIKPENFAIRKDLTVSPQVVAIDVDMAFFEPKMRDILEQNCSSDDDCNFFDCSSRCNLSKRRCSPRRSNSNLQVICEKIFRPWFSPTLLGAKAALPLQVELQRALQECSATEGGVEESEEDGGGGGGGGGGRGVHQRLFSVLKRLIQEGGASDESGEAWEGKGHAHTALNF
ncbi:divergent protein kinase domain 1C isoform X1 [Pundamilia nyererei]|uniref:Protein FAM69C isoform X1 n=1 Tax=Pundamilia nyererei TaxID=303518 RepID=A0A9Y6JLK2_9CICH|nr:PREDICTED: protein FAM69C isoform X1 [Pundamilia nyererei]XP_013770741.1 PREDICTED: protein FAM69C isoform X1 [Pundamilia nyererei]